MKNFFRRLCRIVYDSRYGLWYSPIPEKCLKAWESVIGESFTCPFSLGAPETGTRLSFAEAYRDLRSPLEWPDLLANGLFLLFCAWGLHRALLVPQSFWGFLLLLLVTAVGLWCGCLLNFAGCLGAPRFRTTRGAEQLRRGCGATRRVMFDTSPLPGWRMRSCAPVCERLGCQPLAQVPISYAIFLPRAVLRHFRTADSA
jgi:hypothetical protein